MGGHIRHLVSFNVKRLYSLLLLRYSVLRAFDESAVCPTTLVRTPEQNPHGSGCRRAVDSAHCLTGGGDALQRAR